MSSFRRQPTALFLCAPHLGILDNWLPVIRGLKRERPGLRLIALVPDEKILEQVAADDPLVRLADDAIDDVVVRHKGQRCLRSSNFARASIAASLSQSLRQVARRCGPPLARLANDRMGLAVQRLVLFMAGVVRSRRLRPLWRVVDRVTGRRRWFELGALSDEVDLVCYDLAQEANDELQALLEPFLGVPRFSIYHGIVTNDVFASRPRTTLGESTAGITKFLASDLERQAWGRRFGLEDSSMETVGIVRHDPAWIEQVVATSNRVHPLPWPRFVLIVSRPSHRQYLPRSEKRQAIEEVHRLVTDRLGLPILVKAHPKEGVDGLFEQVLGLGRYGRTWAYTRSHPFHLAVGAALVVSFRSSVDLDMVVCGVPTINRRNDRADRAAAGNGSSVNGAEGATVTAFAQRSALVPVARNADEFAGLVTSLLAEKSSDRLRRAYDAAFPSPNGAVGRVVQCLLTALPGYGDDAKA